jgi:hypothetical protein
LQLLLDPEDDTIFDSNTDCCGTELQEVSAFNQKQRADVPSCARTFTALIAYSIW